MNSFYVLRSSKWRLSSWLFSLCGKCCFSEVSHPQQYSIATRDTVIPMNIEVPMKYLLSHNGRIVVFEIHLQSESPMLYRPLLCGNWNNLSLTRIALKDKFPMRTVPLTAVLPNYQIFMLDPVGTVLQSAGMWSCVIRQTSNRLHGGMSHNTVLLICFC